MGTAPDHVLKNATLALTLALTRDVTWFCSALPGGWHLGTFRLPLQVGFLAKTPTRVNQTKRPMCTVLLTL